MADRPARLNLVNTLVLFLASAASVALLHRASHATAVWEIALCALTFSFTANTLFSLFHEAVHGVLFSRRALNEWGGRWAGVFFPTGLLMQRAFHLTHHRNNRSPLEQFDILHEGDVAWLQRAQGYAILPGVYWVVAVFGAVAFLFIPRALATRSLRDGGQVSTQTSSSAYLEALDRIPPVRARLEIAGAFALQAALFVLCDLSLVGWLACYAAFGLQWSSLQYADHAFSPLDPRDGAHDLRVSVLTRAFFLNYHLHLAHHRDPKASWVQLPALVDEARDRPSFWRVWLRMWRGPVKEADFLAELGATTEGASSEAALPSNRVAEAQT